MGIIFLSVLNVPLEKLDITDARYTETNGFKKVGKFYRETVLKGILVFTQKIITTEDTINLTSSLRNYLYQPIPITIVRVDGEETYLSDSDYFDKFDSSWLWLGKIEKMKFKKSKLEELDPLPFNINLKFHKGQKILINQKVYHFKSSNYNGKYIINTEEGKVFQSQEVLTPRYLGYLDFKEV